MKTLLPTRIGTCPSPPEPALTAGVGSGNVALSASPSSAPPFGIRRSVVEPSAFGVTVGVHPVAVFTEPPFSV